ncbi:uncharacterized protein LOC110702007 isoform X2 [Chenopodium quinoa]|uniref:uncharacterized protein LOC110702007 isoform X2 n=1 Tax=Chenopodium quinoa TaxID=63459 RepID=UPI000B798B51|nr:uncharacterized protein LOC110702007 isoform X2 [Chenopodium quinoa]
MVVKVFKLQITPLHLVVMYDAKGTEMSAIHMINSLNSQGAALSTRNSLFVQENEDISSLSLEKANEKEIIKDELMSIDVYKAVCNGE